MSAITTQYEVPARWPSPIPDTITPFNPAHHWSHLQNYGEPFRADSINKWALGGAPFSDSSGKIKDKWRIIDSQLSAKGISMTELLGFLPLSLSQSLSSHSLHICLPVWSVQLLVAPPAPPGIKPSINTQQKGENLLKTSITAIRIRREASDLILYGNPWVCPETELCLLILPTLQHTLREAMQDLKKRSQLAQTNTFQCSQVFLIDTLLCRTRSFFCLFEEAHYFQVFVGSNNLASVRSVICLLFAVSAASN